MRGRPRPAGEPARSARGRRARPVDGGRGRVRGRTIPARCGRRERGARRRWRFETAIAAARGSASGMRHGDERRGRASPHRVVGPCHAVRWLAHPGEPVGDRGASGRLSRRQRASGSSREGPRARATPYAARRPAPDHARDSGVSTDRRAPASRGVAEVAASPRLRGARAGPRSARPSRRGRPPPGGRDSTPVSRHERTADRGTPRHATLDAPRAIAREDADAAVASRDRGPGDPSGAAAGARLAALDAGALAREPTSCSGARSSLDRARRRADARPLLAALGRAGPGPGRGRGRLPRGAPGGENRMPALGGQEGRASPRRHGPSRGATDQD